MANKIYTKDEISNILRSKDYANCSDVEKKQIDGLALLHTAPE